jgi:hypothetical protein
MHKLFMYLLFSCPLLNMLFTHYNKQGQKHICNSTIFSFYTFGYYKSYPLNKNLILEICKKKNVTMLPQNICTNKISA